MPRRLKVSHRGVKYDGIASSSRHPFYGLAESYFDRIPLPIIADLGGHDGAAWQSTEGVEIMILDRSLGEDTSGRMPSRQWEATEPIPLTSESVGMVHMSHLIEHLEVDVLLGVLRESDRVLAEGGYLVISSPLLWEGFFDDITHVRPYGPWALQWYLTERQGPVSRPKISASYREIELVFRVRSTELFPGVVSDSGPASRTLSVARFLARQAGAWRYEKTGFTLVLQKVQADGRPLKEPS